MPIRPFFLLTGAFLYLMAIVFAGRGVFELQECGLIGLTPVAGAPRIPVLGLFPTVETLARAGRAGGRAAPRRSSSRGAAVAPAQSPDAQLASGGGRA